GVILRQTDIHQAAGDDLRAGQDGILGAPEALAHPADDVQVAVVGGEDRTVLDVDDAAAGQVVRGEDEVALLHLCYYKTNSR
ncbi:MAG: hypothetical protein ABTA16_03470, partial [Niallia sp.]